ncbi:MAG: D-alanyl-D-alanine carboxypeptidase family protein [Thermoleophilaceae bacterium]
MTRPLLLAVLLCALGVGGCSLGGDDSAPPPAVRSQLPPASPSSPASVSLEGDDEFEIHFRLRPPRAGIVFDLASGDVLWRRRPVEAQPVASLTKVMTALVVATTTRPRDLVRIHPDALRYTGRSVGVLKRGKQVPVEALLSAALITSANDAATALAHHVGGSIAGFARLMNERARVLGLSCTRFVTPYGGEKGDRSCAADLAALTRLAMAEHRIARIVRIPYTQIRADVKGKRLYLATTNPLLTSGYRGTIGLKTGYTVPAGRCLIAVVRRGGRTLGAVLLDSPNPGEQAKRLLGKAFKNA